MGPIRPPVPDDGQGRLYPQPWARALLRRAGWRGKGTTAIDLPADLIDPAQRDHLERWLHVLGARWSSVAAAWVFPKGTDMQATLKQATDAPLHGPFLQETTPRLAAQLWEVSAAVAGRVVLEPSCGHGALVSYLLAMGAKVWAVEVDRASYEVMLHRNPDVLRSWHRDFLDWSREMQKLPEIRVPHIIAHPPFSSAVRHVVAALPLLALGGTYTGVVPAHYALPDKPMLLADALAKPGLEHDFIRLPENSVTSGDKDVPAAILGVARYE